MVTATMRYEGQIYRPPSEAESYILQATVGCSWNHCTYCDMYRSKPFRVRDLAEIHDDIRQARLAFGGEVDRVFVADGDGLVMDLEHWEAMLTACRDAFPRLRRVSVYATAMNLLEKSPAELERLRELGLSLLYIGPETGDDDTFRRIAKGADFKDHVEAARRAREAGMSLSTIFLLGIGGVENSQRHAEASARLITEMDPEYLSLLTLMVIPGTPLGRQLERDSFAVPTAEGLLEELRTIVALAEPTDAVFRTNHASNLLPLSGQLPRDRERILEVVDHALSGAIALRPEWLRGL
jgi:radical SAM superfamily enzyme YgiQ (UPF0313 family)